MRFSLVLALAALPFLVAAVPLEEGPHKGFAISLANPSEFGNADGVVEHSLKSKLRKIKNKIDQIESTVEFVFYTFFYRKFVNFLTTRSSVVNMLASSRYFI